MYNPSYLNLDGATDVLHGGDAGNCEGNSAPHHVSHGRGRVGVEIIEAEIRDDYFIRWPRFSDFVFILEKSSDMEELKFNLA